MSVDFVTCGSGMQWGGELFRWLKDWVS